MNGRIERKTIIVHILTAIVCMIIVLVDIQRSCKNIAKN